ncbi:hypothetical protein D782_3402 [Enterobacteriaceae bacterium strain FGI 57]|nr:hypothetical protein D782_3402 [Enterobacteriaceae bacterium strain FGI 57]
MKPAALIVTLFATLWTVYQPSQLILPLLWGRIHPISSITIFCRYANTETVFYHASAVYQCDKKNPLSEGNGFLLKL